ncbi:DNA cytosine methyltransferase [Terasakiella sp.]|uniref:DNA cytosine methyltransferase n=1 Tax=Terasakiella sp. TaxID=2034861 RepID=UPI003AA89D51
MQPKLKVLSLFAGIGGIDLGLEATGGFETIAFCEKEPYAQRVLKKHWPDVPIFDDVRKLKGEDIGTADVICGGFPCQPFSTAGKRDGTKDDRHLWPEMLRLIEEIKPTWVIGENVAGFTSMVEQSRDLGVESRTCIRYEDGFDYEAVSVRQDELLLHNVCEDLSQIGYEVQPFLIPAVSLDAPHRRDRVWIVAHTSGNRKQRSESRVLRKQGRKPASARGENLRQQDGSDDSIVSQPTSQALSDSNGSRCTTRAERPGRETRTDACRRSAGPVMAHSDSMREQQQGRSQCEKREWPCDCCQEPAPLAHPECLGRRQMEQPISSGAKSKGATNPTEHSSFTRGRARWSPEPDVGRVAHGVPHRVDRLRGLGNAVVPGIPEEIGHAILTVEASLQDASIDT